MNLRFRVSGGHRVITNRSWCVVAITLSLVLTPLGHSKRDLYSASTTPQILLDNSGPDSNQAATLDSVCLSRDPFHVHLPHRCWLEGADQSTRVTIFIANLAAGIPVTVNLVDATAKVLVFRLKTCSRFRTPISYRSRSHCRISSRLAHVTSV